MKTNLDKILTNYDLKRGSRERYMWEYYKEDNCPVFNRKAVSALKKASHTNLHSNFMKDIVSLKVGYMGEKVNLTYNGEDETVAAIFEEFLTKNTMDILTSDTVAKTTISGISHKLLYIQAGNTLGEGVVKVKNISPENGTVVYDYDDTPMNPNAAYLYYTKENIEGVITDHCDIYTDETVSYYKKTSKSNFQLINEEQHFFGEVPIIPFINNDLQKGDCESVVGRDNRDGIMDVYDEILSDTSGEVKAMRLAFLKIFGTLYTGMDANGDEIDINKWLTQTSTMNFPIDEAGNKIGDAEFLEKNINDTVIENLLNRLRTSIYEKSGSIDVKQIAEGSNQRVISIKAQLMRLENNCSTTESYIKVGMVKMLRLFASWVKQYHDITVNDKDLTVSFERVFPTDIQAKTEIFMNLASTLDLKDALRIAGFEDYEIVADRALGMED